jgi:hypothetical protein
MSDQQQVSGGSPTEPPQDTKETKALQIDPALTVDDVNYEKRYDEMQKEVERGIRYSRLTTFCLLI